MFLSGGSLAAVADRVRDSDGLLDLDFWVDSRAQLERASVFSGPARLVDIYHGNGRRLRMEATGLTRRRLSVPPERASWLPGEEHAQLAADVVSLVDRAIPVLPESHVRAGRILRSDDVGSVLARGFGPRFDDESRGGPWLADIAGRLGDALSSVAGIPRNLPPKASCDALVVDGSGRLHLIDAEAPRSPEIGFAPSRATQNLALWDTWVAADPQAMAHLQTVARLREGLGLCPPGTADLLSGVDAGTTTFVLVTETGVSAALVTRLEQAASALVGAGLLDRSRFGYRITSPDET
ncbi:hypothetical protein BH09ACT12_BH09ACT12_30380 [soil metagenome]